MFNIGKPTENISKLTGNHKIRSTLCLFLPLAKQVNWLCTGTACRQFFFSFDMEQQQDRLESRSSLLTMSQRKSAGTAKDTEDLCD